VENLTADDAAKILSVSSPPLRLSNDINYNHNSLLNYLRINNMDKLIKISMTI